MKRCALRGPILVLVVALAACTAGIGRDELLKEMQAGAAPLVVDVRSGREYDRGHIPGAVHIPFTNIASGLNQLGVQHEQPMVIYCEHGPRAVVANWSLYLSGYRNVFSLEGHMKAWREHQFPIETISP